MAEILLLRHSKTAGNLLGRYIGSRTDEPLCEEGRRLLQEKHYPAVEQVYCSPMKRCMETANMLWPDQEPKPMAELRECDFGDFENKNYQELSGNADYQAWVDSGGILPFPGGESAESFKARCILAFARIAKRLREDERIALVVHGGTIMSIMEKYGLPRQSYYDYQVKNAEGFLLTPAKEAGLWNYRYVQ